MQQRHRERVIENFETGNGKGNAFVVSTAAGRGRESASSRRRRRRRRLHDAAISIISFGEFTARARMQQL